MNKELKLTPQDYSNAANTFLVGFILAQFPAVILIRQIGPPRQFAMAMFLVRSFSK